ncbi:Zinc finger, PHD-type [Sesbania bispinosa]|nr:Zinc finger, PHD-type [Sesbania bispinosa]
MRQALREARNNRPYTLRERRYIDYAEPEFNDNENVEDHIVSRPNIPTERRNTASSSSFIPPPPATETVMVNSVVDNIARETVMVNSVVENIQRETVMVNSLLDNIPRHCKGRRSRTAKKTSKTEQKRQNSEVGQTSTIEIDPPLHEGSSQGQGCSVERVSSIPEATSSSKKTILSLLIDRKHIQEDEQVFYKHDDRNEGSAAAMGLRGRITRGGILCSCCQKEMSVWAFERHANSDHRKPYERIYILQTQENLQDCLIAVWLHSTERERREEFCFLPKEKQQDDPCSICANGGDIFHCEHCPSAFHASCMNMERAPRRDWSCPYCVCKYCSLRVYGKQRQLITCLQCDKNFHWQCLKEFSKDPVDISGDLLYCSQSCKEIYDELERSIAVNSEFENYTWSIIRPQTTLAMTRYFECNAKVLVAFSLMNECFQTITDRHTGINVVQNVLYSCRSPDLTRVNFGRFHIFILEKDDAIECAASIRIHGREVAEMPFIATEGTCRRQGICRNLMIVIESFLCALKVQKLVIQSVPDTSDMWKHKFGFKELAGKFEKELASYNILTLPHASKLYKDLGGNPN